MNELNEAVTVSLTYQTPLEDGGEDLHKLSSELINFLTAKTYSYLTEIFKHQQLISCQFSSCSGYDRKHCKELRESK